MDALELLEDYVNGGVHVPSNRHLTRNYLRCLCHKNSFSSSSSRLLPWLTANHWSASTVMRWNHFDTTSPSSHSSAAVSKNIIAFIISTMGVIRWNVSLSEWQLLTFNPGGFMRTYSYPFYPCSCDCYSWPQGGTAVLKTCHVWPTKHVTWITL